MSLTYNNQNNDSLSILLRKTNAVITVNKDCINFIHSRKGQNVIRKYHYKLEMTDTLQLKKRIITKPVNDIIRSWTYKGEVMTREVIAFHDFINVRVRKFEDLVRLHDDYTMLYERYSRVLVDEPESRAAVLGLLKNVERMQVAIGQIHEQILDAKDDAEGKEENVSKCINTMSEMLNELDDNIPNVHLSLNRSFEVDAYEEKAIEFSDCRALSCKQTIRGANNFPWALQSYVMNEKWYLAYEGEKGGTIVLWDASNKTVSGTLSHHTSKVCSITVYEKDNKLILASGSADKTIKLWDLSSQSLTQTLTGHDDGVSSLTSFTEDDGKIILISGS